MDRKLYINESFKMWGSDYRGIGFSLDDEIFINSYQDDNGEFILIDDRQTIYEGVLDIEDVDIFLRAVVNCGHDAPRYFRELYDYNFSKDFWFSMNKIYEILEVALDEVRHSGYISQDSYDLLLSLCKAPNSKVNLSENDLEKLIKH